MEAPVPPPRRKSTTKLLVSDSTDAEERGSTSPFLQSKGVQLVHKAEVHIPSKDVQSTNNDNSKKSEKRKRKVKRKGTFLVQKKNVLDENVVGRAGEDMEIQSLSGSPKKSHSGTETLSEASSSPSSNKIKLIPLVGNERRKKPSGYATETLSDDSEGEKNKAASSPLSHASKDDVNTNAEPVKGIERNNSPSNNEDEFSNVPPNAVLEAFSVPTPSSRTYTPPQPLPRTTLTQSSEDLIAEKLKNIPGSPHSYCTSSSLDYKDTGSLPKQRPKKHRKKKKLKDEKDPDSTQPDSDDEEISNKSKSPRNKSDSKNNSPEKEGKFICLTVHECEPLKSKHLSSRPYVKITFMDIDSDKVKTNANGETIQPLVTQEYDFSYQRSNVPTWNEDLIIMEHLELIHNQSTLLIIEILTEERNNCIAWGFLKPVAANGASNAGRKLRLQLFKPGNWIKDNVPPPFIWWRRKELKKYKSTLYLTLSGIPRNLIVQNITGEEPMKGEYSEKSPEKSISDDTSESVDRDLEDVKWGRLPSLSCKLPNKYLARLPAGPDGSIAISYSHSGLLLASANKINISVFTFRGRPYLTLQGHSGLVYNLKWSYNDKYLATVSADFTACIWDVGKKISAPVQIVSHPSYVYSCAWLDNTTYATGCFDSDIRIWKVGTTSLHQQVSRHVGQINTLLTYDNFLISGDSCGAIYIWKWDNSGTIMFEKELCIREIRGKVINKLSIHPGKKRILVHTRDSVLRMVDIATGSVLHWFQGLVNTKLREDSTFCGCGSLVLAWSEDSTLCAWDSNTGAQAAIYPGLIPDSRPGVIDFHPRDHMMAVSAHSSLAPTLSILSYDRKSNGREVSLVLLNGGIYLPHSEMRVSSSDRSCESTPKKKDSLLKTLLAPRRKVKKDNSTPPSIENSFTDVSKIQGVPMKLEMIDGPPKENRLTDIIKRMDKILVAVSHNNGVYTS